MCIRDSHVAESCRALTCWPACSPGRGGSTRERKQPPSRWWEASIHEERKRNKPLFASRRRRDVVARGPVRGADSPWREPVRLPCTEWGSFGPGHIEWLRVETAGEDAIEFRCRLPSGVQEALSVGAIQRVQVLLHHMVKRGLRSSTLVDQRSHVDPQQARGSPVLPAISRACAHLALSRTFSRVSRTLVLTDRSTTTRRRSPRSRGPRRRTTSS